jgi:hypothetical protein
MQALKLCMDRIVPPGRDRPVRFAMTPVNDATDASKALSAVLIAVANGEIDPGEASSIAGLLSAYRGTADMAELETRLRVLEADLGVARHDRTG